VKPSSLEQDITEQPGDTREKEVSERKVKRDAGRELEESGRVLRDAFESVNILEMEINMQEGRLRVADPRSGPRLCEAQQCRVGVDSIS
jgi:hypothetical protein